MSNGISFSGLASGLDTASIVKQLVALERRPISLLNTRKSSFKKQKDLFGALQDKLGKLRDAANSLRRNNQMLSFKADTDNTGYVKASAGASATTGTYTIDVAKLAKAEVQTSNGKADSSTTGYGNGLLQFTMDGNTYNVSISSTNSGDTLDGIAAAINADSSVPITASVVNTNDPGGNPYKLVLTSDNTGSDGTFTIAADGTSDPSLVSFAAELNGNELVTGTDAQFKLNGVTMYRSSNTFSDAIQGVTIDLLGVHSDPPTSDPQETKVTVTTDGEATSESVKAFVDAYNELVDYFEAQSKVEQVDDDSGDGKKTKAGPLAGDSTLRSIRSGLRNILGNSVATGNNSYALLSQIGITSDRDGKLTFSQSDFEEALADDPDAVEKLFTDSTNGIAYTLYSSIDDYTNSVDGIIKARTDGIDRTMRDIDRQIARAEDHVTRYEEQLTMKYARLEEVMGRLQSMSGALGSLR